jgi:uncharacterized protein (TIGR00266 family)
MQVHLRHQPSASLAIVHLDRYEQCRAEPGAMVSFSDGITIETAAQGGFFGGVKRMLGGESFFQNTYRAPEFGGELTLATQLSGDMRVIDIVAGQNFFLKSGAYVASEMGIEFDTSWGGSRGFFGGAGLLLLRVTGQGKVLMSSYGAIEERVLAPGQRYNVDTGHIVGFDGTLQFNVRRVGGWKSTFFSGEGLICELVGPGRVLMQTRSEEAFLGWLIPKLPSPSSSNG